MPTLLLVRHGQASFGTDDYDRLSPLGTDQALAVAAAMNRTEKGVARIISGSLRRQRQTAQPLADALGVTPTIDARWNEYDSSDVLRAHSATDARVDDPGALDSRAFQGVLDQALLRWIEAGDSSPAGQSWPTFLEQATTGLADAFAGLRSGETGICVSSGGTIAAASASLLGGGRDTFLRLNRVLVNASVTRVVRGNAEPSLLTFNDHAVIAAAGREYVTYR